jgi:cell division FtsZ-interacting protein ZapD
MTKKYRTKQTVIDEQNEKIKDLEDKIRFAEFREESYQQRLKYEARKFSDIIGAEASITVCEDTYRPDTPATVLASIQVFEELFDAEVGGEMKTDLLKEMDKLSEALSVFYSALECDIRINMSINRY